MNKVLMLRKILSAGGFIDQVVTGNVPLVLSDAAAKSIVSLIRYGLCTQSSTPTPSNPVPIKCNNGILKLVDDELPVGFKRLASIKFDGDFWYETGEVMAGDDDVTMTLSETVTAGKNVFGSYNGTSEGTKNFSLYLYGGGSTSNCYLRYGGQLLRPRFGSGERTITFGKSGTSGFSVDVTAEPETFTTVAGAFIGKLPNSSSPAYTGSIVGNILVGTRLKWIPCERESDGVVGYYEAVKGVFLEPVGTGTPVKGDYDFSLSHINAVGTPEVLTVTDEDSNTQTAYVGNLLSVGSYADTQEIIGGAVTMACGITILTGEESGWALSDSGTTHRFRGTKPDDCYTPSGRAPILSSHFVYVATGQGQGGTFIGASQYWYFIPIDQTIDTADKWKTWLAEQYAAGTPVIIVYPLSEATTESVARQSLSTVAGTNVVDSVANVSPVGLEIVYKKKK